MISTIAASKIDKEVRGLSALYSSVRIKTGLELASRLKKIRDSKLYTVLDIKAYPSFNRYIESLGMKYSTVAQIIGLYETFVLVGEYSIEELANFSYHKLVQIKPYLFKKEEGEYKLSKSKSELKKWVKEAGSDLTINDLMIKIKEEKIGQHEHKWSKFKKCQLCRILEYNN